MLLQIFNAKKYNFFQEKIFLEKKKKKTFRNLKAEKFFSGNEKLYFF